MRRCVVHLEATTLDGLLVASGMCGQQVGKGFIAPVCPNCCLYLSRLAGSAPSGFLRATAQLARAISLEARS